MKSAGPATTQATPRHSGRSGMISSSWPPAEMAGGHDEEIIPDRPEWRGWACVVAGPALFIVGGYYGGLIPAAFLCVFVASLGDRTATLGRSLVLAAGVTLLGVVLFYYVLGVPFPSGRWMSGW